MYRSQGFDGSRGFPSRTASPERFLLIRSRVPVALPESHLLAGATAGGIRKLRVEPESFRTGVGVPLGVDVTLVNGGATPLTDLELSLELPPEWKLDGDASIGRSAREKTRRSGIECRRRRSARSRSQSAARRLLSRSRRRLPSVRGENFAWIQAGAPVEVRFLASLRRRRLPNVRERDPHRLGHRDPAHESTRRPRTDERSQGRSLQRQSRRRSDVALGARASTGHRRWRNLPELTVPPKEPRGALLRLTVDERVLPPRDTRRRSPMKMRVDASGLASED